MTQPNPRLWEFSTEIQQLETALVLLLEDDSLTDEERETKLEQTFDGSSPNSLLIEPRKVIRPFAKVRK